MTKEQITSVLGAGPHGDAPSDARPDGQSVLPAAEVTAALTVSAGDHSPAETVRAAGDHSDQSDAVPRLQHLKARRGTHLIGEDSNRLW